MTVSFDSKVNWAWSVVVLVSVDMMKKEMKNGRMQEILMPGMLRYES